MKILKLRDEGLSFYKIGELCGVTGERIRQIFYKKGVWIRW